MIDWLIKSKWRVWWVFFFYTIIVSLAIQLFILPVILPQWHAGGGLINSCYDCITYHNIAVNLADKILREGWQAWQLKPYGQAPAGIAAVFYALTFPELWTMIPLNAAVHATAALLLLSILGFFIENRSKALLCVLPFFIYPSAALWYAQILKDGYFILGCFLYIFGWLMLAKRLNKPDSKLFYLIFLPSVFIFLGHVIVWIVRPYFLKIFLLINIINGILLSLFSMRLFLSSKTKIIFYKAKLSIIVILTLAVLSFTVAAIKKPAFTSLKNARSGFLTTKGNSSIDESRAFYDIEDMLSYIPRAMQIALFSPFPCQWFQKGSSDENTAMRKIVGFEMTGVYFALFFLPYAVWYWRKKIEMWLILIFCILPLLFYGLTICNIGTLHRFRYGFLMLIVAFGIAGMLLIKEKYDSKK